METWSTHLLYQQAAVSQGTKAATQLQLYAQRLISNQVAVVFTLGHLSKITGISYRVLHDSVNRKREAANYRMYAVAKRSGGRRFIHSVCADLFRVQQFINQEILQKRQPHSASFAFHPTGGIRKCASMHCGAKWVFQFDLTDFFYDVTEIDAYQIFRGLGYRPLLAFEFARLCTTTHLPKRQNRLLYHQSANFPFDLDATTDSDEEITKFPYPDEYGVMGVLSVSRFSRCQPFTICSSPKITARYIDGMTVGFLAKATAVPPDIRENFVFKVLSYPMRRIAK